MNADKIAAIDARARALFTPKPDEGPDDWHSYADEVDAGKGFAGDCDDLAETVLELLARAGAAMTDLYRVWVLDRFGRGHLFGNVWDDNGDAWVVGDTLFPGPYRASQIAPMQYTPYQYNRLSEAGPGEEPNWRSGLPWAPAA